MQFKVQNTSAAVYIDVSIFHLAEVKPLQGVPVYEFDSHLICRSIFPHPDPSPYHHLPILQMHEHFNE